MENRVATSANSSLARFSTSSDGIRRNKKRVLDEDSYVEMLENVIERQYFPHLSKMKQQLEFLQKNEKFSLHTLRLTYNSIATSGEEVHDSGNFDSTSSMTVAEFFSRYTSEDNKSFDAIFSKDLENRRRKFHWLHESIDRLAITDGSKHSETNQKAGMLMLYYIGNKILTAEERERMDKILAGEKTIGDDRPSQVDSWAFRVRNQLMFYPELKDSLQISGIVASNPGNISSNRLLLCSSKDSSSSDSRIRSALPTSNNTSLRQNLIANGKETNFAVPKAPSRKISSNSTSIVSLNSQGSSQVAQYTDSYANNDPRRADKVIVPRNSITPGVAFADSVDSYLKGSSYIPRPEEAAILDAVLPASVVPLEAAHTPSTIASISSINPNANLPQPPPQMPVLFRNSYPNRRQQEDEWENGSVSGDREGNLHRGYVPMTPLMVPGEGLLRSPIITWGKLCGPIVILSGPLAGKSTQDVLAFGSDTNKNLHKKDNLRTKQKVDEPDLRFSRINPHAVSLSNPSILSALNSQSLEEASVSFHFQVPRQRELIAMKLDEKAQSRKRQKTHELSHRSKASVGNAQNFITPMKKLAEMSPAAQSLAQKVHSSLKKQQLK